MKATLTKFLIPSLAMILGGATTLLLAWWCRPSDVPLQEAIQQFNELDPATQEQLRNIAGGFQTRSSEERERLQQIHAAVQENPALETKLRELQEWWLSLTPAERGRFQNTDGKFVTNWAESVQSAWSSSAARSRHVSISWPLRGVRTPPNFEFSLDQYQQLLEDVIPQPAPPELQRKLDGFPNEEESLERMLTKTVWLMNQFFTTPPGEPSRQIVSAERFRQAIDDFLLDSPSRNTLLELVKDLNGRFGERQRPPDDSSKEEPASDANNSERRPVDGMARFRDIVVSGFFLRGTLEHLNIQIRRSRASDPDQDLLSFYESGLDRQQQLDLMRRDPAEAEHAIKDLMFAKVNTENPALADLSKDVSAIRNRWDPRSFSRSGFDPRRGGNRSGFGSGPPRGRDDSRNDEREDGRTGIPRGNGPAKDADQPTQPQGKGSSKSD